MAVSPTCDKPDNGSFNTYLYDAADARIFKSGNAGGEYYQRDAAGHELFVYNISQDKYTWYVYGNERIAKIGEVPPVTDDNACRPRPICDAAMSQFQQDFLQNLAYVTSPGSINYPTKLFRIRLCNGFEPHLLASELTGLPGNYRILQQIDLTSPNQQLSLWQSSGLSTANFSQVLSLRIGNDQFLLDGYNPCGGFDCPTDFIACGEAGEQQAASITNLQSQYVGLNSNNVSLPAAIVRLRLCDGSEIYALLEMLPGIAGNYTILQQIEVTERDQTFSLSADGGATITVNLDKVLALLLQTGTDVNVDGYSSCINDEPCDPGLPECTYEMATSQLEAMQALRQVFLLAQPGHYHYPTRLYRIRLCYGDELYVMQEELAHVPGNFRYLQEIIVSDPGQIFSMKIDNGYQVLDVNGNLADLFSYRRGDRQKWLYSVNGYLPCGELSPCHPGAPGCTPEETYAQQQQVAQLLQAMAALPAGAVQLPGRLFLVRFCDGSTLYVLEQEMTHPLGSISIIQEIPLTSLGMTFTVIDRVGNSSVVTLEELLQLRQGMDITVSGYGCSPATVEHSGSCTYKITHENYGVELAGWENPLYVTVFYESIVTRNCGAGTEEILRITRDTTFLYDPRWHRVFRL